MDGIPEIFVQMDDRTPISKKDAVNGSSLVADS